MTFIGFSLYPYCSRNLHNRENGWSVHKSNVLKIFETLNPRLHLIPSPTCSYWMNPIERVFSRVYKEAMDNSNFKSYL